MTAEPDDRTQIELAERFVEELDGALRYCPGRGWLSWYGSHYAPDDLRRRYDRAREFVKTAAAEWPATDRRRVCSSAGVNAIVDLARSDRRTVVDPREMDADPYRLHCATLAVDLRTGQTTLADPSHLNSRRCAVNPQPGPCPTWERSLHQWMEGDRELLAYMKRVIGYILTGSTDEQVFFIGLGPGRNGKSVLMRVLSELLGGVDPASYSGMFSSDALVASHYQQHPAWLAALVGSRLAVASEIDPSLRWNEALLKTLTGGDAVTARRMRMDPFVFVPQFKIFILSNHEPRLSTDDAMRRRLHVIPFTYRVPDDQVDPKLLTKLRAEMPHILHWAIEGCREWQGQGLNPPEAVRRASAQLFENQDAVGEWIAERCETGVGKWDTSTALYRSWKDYAISMSNPPGTTSALKQALENRGFAWRRTRTDRRHLGIAVKIDSHFPGNYP